MLNHITIMGRFTRDPELKRTTQGVPVVSFTLAVERDYQTGEEKISDFIDVVAWRNTAEFVSRYFAKGRMAVVSGRLQIRDWTDKEGIKRRNAEIIADNVYFGDSKREQSGKNAQSSDAGSYAEPYMGNAGNPYGEFSEIDDEDEHLSF